jgi:hypothetical protein
MDVRSGEVTKAAVDYPRQLLLCAALEQSPDFGVPVLALAHVGGYDWRVEQRADAGTNR